MIEIRHTGLVTKNLKKSLKFWCYLLGFKIKSNALEKGKTIDKVLGYKEVLVKTYKLKDKKNNLLELLYFKNSPKIKKNFIKPYSEGYTHISLTVKNINLIYKKLKKFKIKFNSKPKLSADGKVLMTYCKTPEGSYLELVEVL
jgi:catechol 2,3-dioxygenase-like lactoylglutathione lyase family enzyme